MRNAPQDVVIMSRLFIFVISFFSSVSANEVFQKKDKDIILSFNKSVEVRISSAEIKDIEFQNQFNVYLIESVYSSNEIAFYQLPHAKGATDQDIIEDLTQYQKFKKKQVECVKDRCSIILESEKKKYSYYLYYKKGKLFTFYNRDISKEVVDKEVSMLKKVKFFFKGYEL
jgi:hypothetical protein